MVSCFCFSQNEYMKDNFLIMIETWHKPDLGEQENVSASQRECALVLRNLLAT